MYNTSCPSLCKTAPGNGGERAVDKCTENPVLCGFRLLLVIVVPDRFHEGEFIPVQEPDYSLIKACAGRFSGICHSSFIYMLPMVDGNEIDNLLLLIR
jgi:hypothetical protein